ncbi:MAG: hypothetical protein AAGD32_02240 [Planctomycetota bacterium]
MSAILLALSLLGSAPATRPAVDRPDVVRPMDPWVFRCVLDGEPRRLVVALSDQCFMSYDLDRCVLDKMWVPAEDGGVELTGTVYDHRHGPQPSSRGTIVYEVGDTDRWTLFRDGEPTELALRYVGHRDVRLGVQLHFEAEVDGKRLEIVEYIADIRAVHRRSIGVTAPEVRGTLRTPCGHELVLEADDGPTWLQLGRWMGETLFNREPEAEG